MNILIIEDEAIAARRIKKMVNEFDSNNHIVGQVDSVESAVEWFEKNPYTAQPMQLSRSSKM